VLCFQNEYSDDVWSKPSKTLLSAGAEAGRLLDSWVRRDLRPKEKGLPHAEGGRS